MRIPTSWLKSYVKLPRSLKVLTEKLTLAGHMLDKIEKAGGETIIDLELRGNRADCYSILGIAREVQGIFGHPVKNPALHSGLKKVSQLKACQIEVKSDYVKRVMALVIKNIKITPSPAWLKKRLEAYGVATINNIVDLTNYVMLETGEPMHAFDLDLVKPKITIRMAKKNEKMITFEKDEIITTDDDLVWAKEGQLLSIAGAIGSKDYSILPTTKNILVEAASYDQANIRRTCRRHNLLTEAGLRHEKDLDPNLVAQAIYRFCYLLKKNQWGKIEPPVLDYYPKPRKEPIIELNYQAIEKLGGVKIEPQVVGKILKDLNIKIVKRSDKKLTVSIPTYRTDITQEADLIEEVLRIYGYDRIPSKILSLEIPPVTTPLSITQEEKIKKILTGLGFNEIIGTSFASENYKAFNFSLDDQARRPVIISNPPSPDFEEMQLSLMPNLVETSKKLIDRGGREALFFEIGKVYFQSGEKYQEERKLGLAFYQEGKHFKNYLTFKGYLEALFKALNLVNLTFRENKNQVFSQFAFDVLIGEKKIATGGQTNLGIFFTEIDLEKILKLEKDWQVKLWSKYPLISEDLTLILPPKTLVGDLIQSIKSVSPLIKSVNLVDSYKDARTFRATYQSEKKTLTTQEVEKIRRKILEKVKREFGAKLKK